MSSLNPPSDLRRHAFVRLTAEAWRTAIPETGDLETLRDWTAHERPLIIRRPCFSPETGEVHLGLALPGKRRLAYRLALVDIASVEAAPLWENCRASMCDDVWETLIPLRATGVAVRMFGSHAWQFLSGLTYVTESSDLDLIAEIDSPRTWNDFCQSMRNVILPMSPRVDLEIVLRGDPSFSWREFVAPGDEVLIKSNQRIWLEPKASLETLLHA